MNIFWTTSGIYSIIIEGKTKIHSLRSRKIEHVKLSSIFFLPVTGVLGVRSAQSHSVSQFFLSFRPYDKEKKRKNLNIWVLHFYSDIYEELSYELKSVNEKSGSPHSHLIGLAERKTVFDFAREEKIKIRWKQIVSEMKLLLRMVSEDLDSYQEVSKLYEYAYVHIRLNNFLHNENQLFSLLKSLCPWHMTCF